MKTLRLPTLAVATLGLLLSTGCEEKKTTPEPKDEPAKVEVKPTPPPQPPNPAPVVERAVKECAAPLDLQAGTDVKIGDRAASDQGYKLTFKDKDADGTLVFGVLGPVNEDSGANMVALKKYLKFFADEKADAIIVTGDVGEVADGIARVLNAVADTRLPVFVIVGNRECRAEYTNGVNQAKANGHPNIVNMNMHRAVEFPEATLVSLPGYHEPKYIACANGCQYFKSTLDEVVKLSKEAKNPVVLVSHGPPRGEGSQALDYTSDGNVGDAQIPEAIKAGNIAFGVASNIKEAGGRATDLPGTTVLKEGAWVKSLFLNPGPADNTVAWQMNDGTRANGLAAVLKIKGDQGAWKLFRARAPTAAEKAEAKKLERPEAGADEGAEKTPAPVQGAADAGK